MECIKSSEDEGDKRLSKNRDTKKCQSLSCRNRCQPVKFTRTKNKPYQRNAKDQEKDRDWQDKIKHLVKTIDKRCSKFFQVIFFAGEYREGCLCDGLAKKRNRCKSQSLCEIKNNVHSSRIIKE